MAERKTIARPGTRRDDNRVGEMIRVDHAGEYGAVTIYQGQRAVFAGLASKARIANQLKSMEADEQHHLDAFDALLMTHDERPTALMPIWTLAGRALGVTTALMGERAAHACTEAVETVIETHYGDQIAELEDRGEVALAATFSTFRDEEIAHRDLAVHEGAKEAAGYPILSGLIQAGCRAAITLSQKL